MGLFKYLFPLAMTRGDISVHLYALCWNDEKMLPYFFKYYDAVVDRYYIYDNGSTDRSLEILSDNPKVVLRDFRTEGDSFGQSAVNHYNECWKQSRGEADWVIICNIDEHVYHPNLRSYLKACKSNGITLVVPEAYEMVSDSFPKADRYLHRSVRYGVREPRYDKPQIFDPNKIEEINFIPGRHLANPSGEVATPKRPKTKLLHYKYVGADYLLPRQSELRLRLRSADIKDGLGVQYTWDDQRQVAELEQRRRRSVRVLRANMWRHFGASRRSGWDHAFADEETTVMQGVYFIPLKKVVNERGHLMEVQREDDSHFPGFGQVYITSTFPGTIKAWYRHHKQIDQIALLKGEVVLALYDSRESSPTNGKILDVLISEKNPKLVQIPPGIWHGFKAIGTEPAYLLHLNSVAYNFDDVDEDRLASDDPVIPYKW
jgi:dTDP-4-dehydrorhamnose 3,5-epimerase-like enzyme